MYAIKYFFLTGISIFLCGCPIITWEKLQTTCSVPVELGYYMKETVDITFSVLPDRKQIEDTVQLKLEEKTIDTFFSWKDNCVKIKPLAVWQKGKRYQIVLSGTLLMNDGRNYSVHLQRDFIYGEPGRETVLVDAPQNKVQVSLDNSLVFTFNKSVQIVSFIEHFSLTPSVENQIAFTENNTVVTVSAKNGLKMNTRYSWKITDITSADGYPLDKEYEGQFFTPTDTELPTIKTVCPVDFTTSGFIWYENRSIDGSLHEKQGIGFEFSKPMNYETVRNGISFTPPVKGFFKALQRDPYRFVFIPQENYQLQKRYQLVISDTVQDTSELKLFEMKKVFFTSANKYLTVDSIKFDAATPITVFPAEDISHTMTKVSTDVVLETKIQFSTVIDPEYRKTAVDAISLGVYFPHSALTPILESVNWDAGGTAVTLKWKNFTVSTASLINRYKLLIKGGANGVKNASGELMEEDVCVIFKAL